MCRLDAGVHDRDGDSRAVESSAPRRIATDERNALRKARGVQRVLDDSRDPEGRGLQVAQSIGADLERDQWHAVVLMKHAMGAPGESRE